MSVKRTEEIEKVRQNLNLNLKIQTHRCEWCDLIKEIKKERKRKSEIVHPRDRLKLQTLWKTSPLSTKARQIKEDDIRIQEYVCNKSNENMD